MCFCMACLWLHTCVCHCARGHKGTTFCRQLSPSITCSRVKWRFSGLSYLLSHLTRPTCCLCLQTCLCVHEDACMCIHIYIYTTVCGGKRSTSGCWRVVSVVKSSSCRGPRFNSQHRHGGSQPFITAVPGELLPSSDLRGYQVYILCPHIYVGRAFIHMT